MQKLLGQEHLFDIFDKLATDKIGLPKTMLFLGETGCGKHTLTNYVAERFGLTLTDVTKTLTPDIITDLYISALPCIYLIDLSNFVEKQQNQFLKFIEEPPSFANIILLAESELGVLPTILNRCTKYRFNPYTADTLKRLYPKITEDIVFKICKTPGQVKDVNQEQVLHLYDMCLGIIRQADRAKLGDFMQLCKMINYKEEYDKFDFWQFLKALPLAAFDVYYQDNNDRALTVYAEVSRKINAMMNRTVSKEAFVTNLLIDIWEITH